MARRPPGKRIDKWDYYHDGVTYHFEVRMLPDDRLMLNSLGEPALRISGSELKKLKTEARNRLKKLVATDWEEWLRVKMVSAIDCDYREDEDQEIEFSLSFEVDRQMFAKTADGQKVHKDKGRTQVYAGWPSDSKKTWGREYSYIKATPENVAALGDIMDRLASLGKQLSEFLGRDKIAKSLASLGARLLPAPNTQEVNNAQTEA